MVDGGLARDDPARLKRSPGMVVIYIFTGRRSRPISPVQPRRESYGDDARRV